MPATSRLDPSLTITPRLSSVPSPAPEHEHGFLTASGKVAGQRLMPRDLYWRRYPARGVASGTVVVVVPDYGESGADWVIAADALSAAGHVVITMDHGWRGFSESDGARLQRGYEIARDTAAVLAMAGAFLRREPYPGELVALSAGLGASAGVLLAMLAQANGELALDGVPMPADVRGVLCAPVLGPSADLGARVLAAVARIPGVGQRALPHGCGFTQPAQLADYLAAWRAARRDLQRSLSQYQGNGLSLEILQGNADPIARPQHAEELERRLGAHLRLLHSPHHDLHHHPHELRWAVESVAHRPGTPNAV